MATILHLDTSPRGERSISRSLTKEFMTGWAASHPDDTVIYRDIGHDVPPPVSETWIAGAFSPPEKHTPEIAETMRLSDQLIDEFMAADRYVIGVPMYNFSIPANFKAYIDQILRVGRTFVVEDGNYKGLALNKKMLVLTARGGAYPPSTPFASYDMQEPYLRLAFGLIGITDITFIHTENLNSGDDARRDAIVKTQTAIKDAIVSW
ncbi:MAG: FMN-dependent NADH-azoreductase [Leptolyngbyaceae cyanobacterium bins.59]|nr:FMN-dependent NADH-azoreductase [Leptolyngbyaceae cyanobacterium bins.59]